MATRIFIDGAAGTTGLEIRDRLADRNEFELLVLDETQRKDVSARKEALHAADVAILCLPDDAAVEAVKLAEGSNTRIIDASSAHRVADGWTYGFPELIGHDRIAEAQFVSNPGCYPTGFLALIGPLVRAGLLPASWPYTVNAISAFSGGGKALIQRFNDELDLAWLGYGLSLNHKHLPEMCKYAQIEHQPVFSPSVIPATRGMIVEVPLQLNAIEGMAMPNDLRSTLREFYHTSPVVTVRSAEQNFDELAVNSDPAPSDRMEIVVFGSSDGNQARLIAWFDNLGKGASGAAIQNLNIMCGDHRIAARKPLLCLKFRH